MKKACLSILSFFLLIISLFFTSSPILAQSCPPLGTNIAGNFERENLEFIAENANCYGPIPITVIITPELVQNPDLLIQLQNDLRELNFDPTWRPWGYVEPDSPELEDWLNAFSLLEIGYLQAWNEWNRYTEVPTIDPARDAQIIQALINAKNAGLINIPIGNTPLDLLNYTDLNYRDYWTQFNQACPGCLNQLDFIVSNVYAPNQYGPNSVQEFLNIWQGELNFLRNLGVDLSNKFFIISESGLAPGAYTDFNQRLQDTILFARALEEAILANPNLFPGLDQITFLLMDDSTGKQYLIYRACDEEGNCEWRVTEYLILNPNIPGSLIPYFPPLACTPSIGGDTDSRPVPCDACNETNMLTPSCATSFTVHDSVKHECCDADFFCDNEAWVVRDWGGTVTIDPSEITIPFVGKKGQEDEQKYLADYFDGTGIYYRPPYDLSNSNDVLRVFKEGGVWRKLAPQSVQDIFKKNMVVRALKSLAGTIQEGAIHNYSVEYKGESTQLSEFANHFPPDDPIDRLNWEKNTIWGRLWKAVPMFSREDTKGYIYPYLGARPADVFTIINPAAQVEKVPHVARLYEVTSAIQKYLLPQILKLETSQGAMEIRNKINAIIASAEKQISGEETEIETNQQVLAKEADKKLLAQVGCKFLYNNNPEGQPADCSCCATGDCRGRHTAEPIAKMGLLCGWTECEDGTPDFCGGVPQAPPEEPGCGFPDPLPVKSCQMDSITDTYPNDDLCCSPILIDLYAVDALLNSDYWECYNAPPECKPIPGCVPPIDPVTGLPCYECCEICKDPCKRVITRSVSRKIGINLLHPYLYEIWLNSAEVLEGAAGLINIFRPEVTPKFEELAAHSQNNVDYHYTSGGVTPSEGFFYFPYLGGVQNAKKWVVRTLNSYYAMPVQPGP